MARTKATAPKPREEPPAASPRQKNVLALKGTDAWKAWLDGYAKKKGMPVTVLVDHSLREQAKRDGYPEPPSRV